MFCDSLVINSRLSSERVSLVACTKLDQFTEFNAVLLDSPKFFSPIFQKHHSAKVFYCQSFLLYGILYISVLLLQVPKRSYENLGIKNKRQAHSNAEVIHL